MALPKETLQQGISLYDPNFISPADADSLFAGLNQLPWQQHIIRMWGKDIPAPRLYDWQGITPTIYGEKIVPTDWTPEALEIRDLSWFSVKWRSSVSVSVDSAPSGGEFQASDFSIRLSQ